MNQITAYLKYNWNAKTKFGVHSAFVYQFVTEVMEDDRHFYVFETINEYRNLVETTHPKAKALPPIYGELLFKILHYYKPNTIIELGINHGIHSLYATTVSENLEYKGWQCVKDGVQDAKILETDHTVSKLEIIKGDFDAHRILERIDTIDCLLINGYALENGFQSYFTQVLSKCHNDTIILIAGLRQTKANWQDWQMLKEHKAITLTIDLFHIGLAFFRKEQLAKEHFTIIDHALKPWKLGFG